MIAVQTVTSTLKRHGFVPFRTRKVYSCWSGKYSTEVVGGDFKCKQIDGNTVKVEFRWSPFSLIGSFSLKKASLIKALTDRGFTVKDVTPTSTIFYVKG